MGKEITKQAFEGVLIVQKGEKQTNPSLLLIDELIARFHIPESEKRDLMDRLAFYGVCYLALFKELKAPEFKPVRNWIDKNLCDVYSHNAIPLEQTLAKYKALKEGDLWQSEHIS